MTNGEAISRVINTVREVTGDSHLPRKLVYSYLQTARMLLMERNKGRIHKYLPKQTLETEQVMLSEVSCVPLDCLVSRAFIGTPLGTKDGPLVSGIGSDDLSLRFDLVNPTEYARKLRLDPNGSYAFIEGDYLYTSEEVPCIRASYIPSGSNAGCDFLEQEFIGPDFLLEAIFEMAVQRLRIYISRPQDVIQNENPNA